MRLRREVQAPGGFEISYLVEGRGPAILIIPDRLQPAVFWERLGYIERFSDTHRVIVIDALGHGESDGPTDPRAYTLEQLVNHVVAVLDQEEVTSGCVWGYGTGAETALAVARRRPDLAAGVIAGGIYLGDYTSGMEAQGVDLSELTERCAAALDIGDWTAYFALIAEPVPEALHDTYASQNRPDAIAAITRADLLRARGFVNPAAPTFVYWAERDVFARQNARLADTLPIQWATVPGRFVDGFMDVDAVVAAVRPFIDSVVRA